MTHRAAAATLLALIVPHEPLAAAPCRPDMAALTAPTQFARYPQRVTAARWQAPDVSRGEARLFRTALRDRTKGPPDFAGHLTLVQIGCGAAVVCPAFVDRRNGRVTFDPALRVVAALPMVMDGPGYASLTYRRNSRLLVVIGTPHEDARLAGVSFYRWQAGRLRLTRFLTLADFCAGRRVTA